jgi:hypothetical protein
MKILNQDELTKLHIIIDNFIEEHEVSSPESIYQQDRVIENAYYLMEQLFDIVGYYEYPED